MLKGIFSSRLPQPFGFFCLALNLKFVCFGNCDIFHNARFKLQPVLIEYIGRAENFPLFGSQLVF